MIERLKIVINCRPWLWVGLVDQCRLQNSYFHLTIGETDLFFDPLGRPTVTAGSDHCFRTCCPSVRPHFSNLEKQTKKFLEKTMFTTGVTMGLAEWIIDDTCLVSDYCYRQGFTKSWIACKYGIEEKAIFRTYSDSKTITGYPWRYII